MTTEVVAFLRGGLDEMRVQPFHELVPDGDIFEARLRKIQSRKEGEAGV